LFLQSVTTRDVAAHTALGVGDTSKVELVVEIGVIAEVFKVLCDGSDVAELGSVEDEGVERRSLQHVVHLLANVHEVCRKRENKYSDTGAVAVVTWLDFDDVLRVGDVRIGGAGAQSLQKVAVCVDLAIERHDFVGDLEII